MITYWTRKGKFRIDIAAIPYDQLHREDGHAIERADGTKMWYVNGNIHRIDGPAIERADGTKKWYVNGNIHRIDGPAVEFQSGTQYWYINGKRHRDGGPAIEYPDGTKMWYLNDNNFTLEEFIQRTPFLKSKSARLAFYLRWK